MKDYKLVQLCLLSCISFMITLSYPTLAVAQVTEKDVEQSKMDKEYAENQKAIAEAKKGKVDALFPKPDVSSLVGGTKVNEGTFIESQILGYCAMKTAASQIGIAINSLPKNPTIKPTNLVVYNEVDVKLLSRYMIMKNHLQNLRISFQTERDAYISELDTVILGGYTLANAQSEVGLNTKRSVIPSIVDIALKTLSLFKTDIELTPTDVAIGEKEFVAEVFSHLTGFTSYYPQTIPMSIQNCTAVAPATCSPLLDQIKDTNDTNSFVLFLKDIKLKNILEDRTEVEVINTRIANGTATPLDIATKAGILANYTSEVNLLTIKGRTAPINSRVDKLTILFNSAMKDLGIVTPPEPKPTNTPSICPSATCSQATTVNVNVGDKEEKKSEGGGRR